MSSCAGSAMAELVGCFAASHGPLLVRDWAGVPEDQKARITAGFRELGRRMDALRPRVLIEVSPDHWGNFHLANVPAVGPWAGGPDAGPPRPFPQPVPAPRLAGAPPPTPAPAQEPL